MKIPPWLPAFVTSSGTSFKAHMHTSLVPLAFDPLPLGSISPSGWLKDQMQLMADGLAGHEHDFFNYVAHSSWLGQDMEYSDLNEGFPYWFNGLVPLAYGLDDARLKQQVHSSAQIVLDRQTSDGWIGPETGAARNFWARYPFFLGLTQLAEANGTWTQPVVSALHRFNQLMHDMMAANYTGYVYHEGDLMNADGYSWGRVRSQDMMITLQWLFEHHPENQSQLLLDNMQSLHEQGLNWEDWYNQAAYFGQGMDKDLNLLDSNLTQDNYAFEHGVNVGQAAAVVRRFTHNNSLVQTAMDGVNWTMMYHGAASGTILADERLVGLSPYSGSELCTSVETMYSLSYLYQAIGISSYADKAELAAFNSLPAMLTPDWWAHQYVQAPNQPYDQNLTETPFYNTNTWGTTFGLEPNYPCCTVNHPQGWPKFLSNSYAKVGRHGLAHVLLSPGSVKTRLARGNEAVSCQTAYPFSDILSYSVVAESPFDFHIRIPDWAGSDSSISIGNEPAAPLSPAPSSGLHRISLPKGKSAVRVTLASSIRTHARANETIAVYKGALLYALEVKNANTSTIPRPYDDPDTYLPEGYAPPQSRDWQYHNAGAWNMAIDPTTLAYHSANNAVQGSAAHQLANPIFAPDAPPGYMTAMGCEIDWSLYLGSVPGYPPTGGNKKCVGQAREVRLVPYGSAKTHMAELPVTKIARE